MPLRLGVGDDPPRPEEVHPCVHPGQVELLTDEGGVKIVEGRVVEQVAAVEPLLFPGQVGPKDLLRPGLRQDLGDVLEAHARSAGPRVDEGPGREDGDALSRRRAVATGRTRGPRTRGRGTTVTEARRVRRDRHRTTIGRALGEREEGGMERAVYGY